jgi:hypothetical protein
MLKSVEILLVIIFGFIVIDRIWGRWRLRRYSGSWLARFLADRVRSERFGMICSLAECIDWWFIGKLGWFLHGRLRV